VRAGLVRRYERRAAGRGAVEGLAGHPLWRLELVVARGQVVQEHVAGNVIHRVALGHVLAAVLDDERDLGLVVHALAPARQADGRRGWGQRVAELGEEGRRLGWLGALLLGVRAVVEADAEELARARDGRQELDALDGDAVVALGHPELVDEAALEDGLDRAVARAGPARGVAKDVVDATVAQKGGARMTERVEAHESHRRGPPYCASTGRCTVRSDSFRVPSFRWQRTSRPAG
jgi:hypothetical protein